MFIIGGLQKTSLLDFPQKVAAIVFTQGCNFCCGYCHNPELLEIKTKSDYSVNLFFEFLENRKGKLDGVVITGGEPTLQSGLYEFVAKIKLMGFAVKLDTNGTNPAVLEKLIKDKMLDYIAMDIKAPIDKYSEITNSKICKENILKSINLIKNSGVDYEFRTTVIKSQLSYQDFDKIGKMLQGAKRYYLQKFIPSKIYDNLLQNETTYSDLQFQEICKNLETYINFVDFR